MRPGRARRGNPALSAERWRFGYGLSILALVGLPGLGLTGPMSGWALPHEDCATAEVTLKARRSDGDWRDIAHGRLEIDAEGGTRRYRIIVGGHQFRFWIREGPDGSTMGNTPPSLIGYLLPDYVAVTRTTSMTLGVSGDVSERVEGVELWAAGARASTSALNPGS